MDTQAADARTNPKGATRDDALVSLRRGLHHFVVTMKNLALYPEGSQTNRQGLSQLHQWLTSQTSARGPLALTVERDGLLTADGERVYQEKPGDAILAFPLFRDGVQSIIFEPQVSEEELKAFIGILLRFRTTTENDQDDVVTAMWEASLTGIKYVIADEYEEVDPEFEVGALKAAMPAPEDRPDIDAPWQASAPVQVDGSAPVAKSVGSLFALAESLDFSFAPGGVDGKVDDPHAGGKLLGEGDGGNGEASYAWDEDGFDPFGPDAGPGGPGGGNGGEDDDLEEDGFAPFQSSKRPEGGNVEEVREDDGLSGLGRISPKKKPGAGKVGGNGKEASGGGNGAASGGEAEDGLEGGNGEEEAEGPGAPTQSSSGGAAWADDALGLDLSGVSMDSFDDHGRVEAQATMPEVDREIQAGRAERLKFWGLSSREIKQISAFIQWDETRSKTSSVLGLVMIILKSPVLKSHMRPYLVAFAAEEIKANAALLSLAHANAFLAELKDLSQNTENKLVKHVGEDIARELDDPELINSIAQAVSGDEELEPVYDGVRYFLYQLPPQAASTLGEALGQAKSLRLKRLFLELMAYFVTGFPLENLPKLVSSLNEWALTELVKLFAAIRRPVPIAILTALVKHGNPQIREAAARFILDYEPENTQLLAPLAADPEHKLRQLAIPALTVRRDPLVENVLLELLTGLAREKKVPEGEQSLLELYRGLGLSAGGRSLGFLKETLLRRDFKSLFERGGDPHRTGAALALSLMPRDTGAADILARASKSAFRNIRHACREASALIKVGAAPG
ncbi:MAG: hypothetical protein LBR53_10225 [Deltaproteobacteria bacterium]|nr:hypothetical protein [Deltaproteobacteria bacterium]